MRREQFLLMKLAEECAEVQQRAIKQMQYGANQVQTGGEVKDGVAAPRKEAGLSNKERLTNEIIDLICILDLLLESGEINPVTDDYEDIKKLKIEKLNKYLKFSNQLGVIPEGFTI